MSQGSPTPDRLKQICPQCSRSFPEELGQAICPNCRADAVDRLQEEIDRMEARGSIKAIDRREVRGERLEPEGERDA